MFIPFLLDTTDLYIHYITAKCKSQENAVLIAIHPTTYRRGGFLAHGVLKCFVHGEKIVDKKIKKLQKKTCILLKT